MGRKLCTNEKGKTFSRRDSVDSAITVSVDRFSDVWFCFEKEGCWDDMFLKYAREGGSLPEDFPWISHSLPISSNLSRVYCGVSSRIKRKRCC